MILVFDLDETLYDERSYVESGLAAVAEFGYSEFGWNKKRSLEQMLHTLDRQGRGAVFNSWLFAHDASSSALVKKCVAVYRHHTPKLKLEAEVKQLLVSLQQYPLYIVTDGHKVVQAKKVAALGLQKYFKHIYITHRYGVAHAKPSTYCFELIKKREQCSWKELVYVGDNPAKDFVNLNKRGAQTVRVLTGVHRNVKAKPGFEAQHRIGNLRKLPGLLRAVLLNKFPA